MPITRQQKRLREERGEKTEEPTMLDTSGKRSQAQLVFFGTEPTSTDETPTEAPTEARASFPTETSTSGPSEALSISSIEDGQGYLATSREMQRTFEGEESTLIAASIGLPSQPYLDTRLKVPTQQQQVDGQAAYAPNDTLEPTVEVTSATLDADTAMLIPPGIHYDFQVINRTTSGEVEATEEFQSYQQAALQGAQTTNWTQAIEDARVTEVAHYRQVYLTWCQSTNF